MTVLSAGSGVGTAGPVAAAHPAGTPRTLSALPAGLAAARSAAWGVLEVDSTTPRDFSEDTTDFMTAAASLIGAFVQRHSAQPDEAARLIAAATLPKPFTMEELLFIILRFVQPEKARRSTRR